jgi:hypothetical protein
LLAIDKFHTLARKGAGAVRGFVKDWAEYIRVAKIKPK